MGVLRAVLTVSDSVLSNSLSLYSLRSFFSAPETALNAFLSSLFGLSFNLDRRRIRYVMEGLEAGYTEQGLSLLSLGCMGCPSEIQRQDGTTTVEITPLLPTTARSRYLFLRLADKIKWPSAVIKIAYPSTPARSRSFTPPLALASSSSLETTVENELDASISAVQ